MITVKKGAAVGVLAVAGLCAASAAPAEGWSVGFGIGESEADDFCSDFRAAFATSSCDDTDSSVKLFGSYRFNENFEVEAFWIDLGEVEGTDIVGDSLEFEASGVGAAAVGILPVSDRLDLLGKVGLFSWDSDASATVSGATFDVSSLDDDGTDPFFAGGIRYWVNDQIGIRGEWEQYELDDTDVTVLSVSGQLRF